MITQKIKDFIKEAYEMTIPSSLPEPLGYNLLVLPLARRKKSKGGILFPDNTEEKQRLASVVVLVLAIGKDAYDKERYPNGPWCQVGDFAIIERDAGNKFSMLEETTERDLIGLRLLADDQVKAKLNSFEDIARVELKL
jgi:co-chaperonin GroES (HSP10)